MSPRDEVLWWKVFKAYYIARLNDVYSTFWGSKKDCDEIITKAMAYLEKKKRWPRS